MYELIVTVGGFPGPPPGAPVVREADGDVRTEALAEPAVAEALGRFDALTEGEGMSGDAETKSSPGVVPGPPGAPAAASEPVCLSWPMTTAVGTVSATTAAAARSTRVRAEARRRREGAGASRTGPGSRGSGPGATGAGSGCVSAGSGSAGSGFTASGATASAGADASAFPRPRAASARIHRRWASTNSSEVAPQRRANRSTGANSPGTASPLQYRWSVDVLTCKRPASTP